MQALVAGDLDIVITSAPNVVNPRLGGADFVMILSIIPTFIDHIISAGQHHHRRAVARQNRFGQSRRQHFRHGNEAVAQTLGHRSGQGRKDRPRRRQSRTAGIDFKGLTHFTIMNEPFIKEAERLGLPRPGQYGDLEDSAAWQRRGYPRNDHQGAAADGQPLRSGDDRSVCTWSKPTRKAPRRLSASIPGSPIRKDWNAPIRITLPSCSTCLMPIPPASRPCSTIWRRKIPRPRRPIRKVSSMRALSRKWKHSGFIKQLSE